MCVGMFMLMFPCLVPRQNSPWPPWQKTYRSGTRWPCPRSPWWTAVRSGWCRPICRSPRPSARASRPSTTDTPRTDRVSPPAPPARLLCPHAAVCCFLKDKNILTKVVPGGFSYFNFLLTGYFLHVRINVCLHMCAWHIQPWSGSAPATLGSRLSSLTPPQPTETAPLRPATSTPLVTGPTPCAT